MKIVINKCYGGFSLSPLAVKRLAELQGRKCFFFVIYVAGSDFRYTPTTLPDNNMRFAAFDIPNPNEVLAKQNGMWCELSPHYLDTRPENRTDPFLIQVVEELGKEANGRCADLKVIEIPDGVDYEIDEYNGSETVNEIHRSWS